MKKLGKLNINSEKIMKNEELLLLRGGYDGDRNCGVICDDNKTCTDLVGPCVLCKAVPGHINDTCGTN